RRIVGPAFDSVPTKGAGNLALEPRASAFDHSRMGLGRSERAKRDGGPTMSHGPRAPALSRPRIDRKIDAAIGRDETGQPVAPLDERVPEGRRRPSRARCYVGRSNEAA